MAYRHINFRDKILWTLAYQLGLDPTKELLIDQAAAITSYVNAWVRKSWDNTDWPEWTTIQVFAPDSNHIVPYNYLVATGGVLTNSISRVFKVYLVDPHLNQGSYDTPFRLFSEGIHCGFEHGTNVWVRFILNPPQFSSDQWDPMRTYQLSDLTYSPVTGECYSSLSNNNIGNDPAGLITPITVPSVIVQQYQPPSLGNPPQPRISSITLSSLSITIPDPPPITSIFNITVMNPTGTVLGTVSHLNNGIDSLTTIATAMATTLQTALSGFTVTSSGNVITITGTSTSDFLLIWSPTNTLPYYELPRLSLFNPLIISQIQPFAPAVPPHGVTPQAVNLTLTNAQVFAGSTYQFSVTDLTGLAHTVSYTALIHDGIQQIMSGLMAAIVASTDTFFQQVFVSLDTTGTILQVRTYLPYAVDIFINPAGSAFWTFIPFPFALADIVLRGAYADILKEWGQNEKAAASEQLAVQEGTARAQTFLGPVVDKLSDQVQPKPRFTVP